MLSLSSLSVASLSLISGIIITITSLGGVNASSLTSYPFHIPGMMGTNMMGTTMMGTQNMMTTQGQLVSVQQAIKMMHNKPMYAKLNSHDNTITFGAKNASIYVYLLGFKRISQTTIYGAIQVETHESMISKTDSMSISER
jgi:hypothetical protein